MSKYYGVSQSHCGHEYRWIYTKESVELEIGEIPTEESVDILWPMGGSNSSATFFTKIEDEEAAIKFLKSKADGPDLEDPELVDIAEYLLTVEIGDGSCTEDILNKYKISKSDLTQYDDIYEHRLKSESMIAEMLQFEEKLPELTNYKEIDRENPFYGESGDIRFSELCDMYDEFKNVVKDWNEKSPGPEERE